jgi:cold shock CspA family protein
MDVNKITRVLEVINIAIGLTALIWYFYPGGNGLPDYGSLKTFKGQLIKVELTSEYFVEITLKDINSDKNLTFISNKTGSSDVFISLKNTLKNDDISILAKDNGQETFKAYEVRVNGKTLDPYSEYVSYMQNRHRRFLGLFVVCLIAFLLFRISLKK